MFFVGLEFSVSKLRRVKSPAIVLALVNTGQDFFMGYLPAPPSFAAIVKTTPFPKKQFSADTAHRISGAATAFPVPSAL